MLFKFFSDRTRNGTIDEGNVRFYRRHFAKFLFYFLNEISLVWLPHSTGRVPKVEFRTGSTGGDGFDVRISISISISFVFIFLLNFFICRYQGVVER